ncbi:MAG: 50S ribosomal protein L23 [Candidatus Omnitrophota bacterium]
MREPYSVIVSLIRTEKSGRLMPLNKYMFCVGMSANKIEIRKAIEDIYKVKVASVNTAIVRGKMKRVRFALGKTSDWKKAIVTLKQGDKIDIA